MLLGIFGSSCVHDPLVSDMPDVPVDTGGVDTSLGGNPCHPDSVYFANDILPLLVSSCAIPGCHDPATAEDGVVLNSYNNIINTGDIEPGDPSDSDLYEVITETDPDKVMPPPGSGLSLTPDQIMDIFVWIQQGALDNSCSDCDTTDVTFSGTVWPIVNTSCTGCHSGSSPQGGVSLTNHAQVAAAAANGSLLGTLRAEPGYTLMPFGGPALSECAIAAIERWIEDGSPDN
jgi:hypothetical protein